MPARPLLARLERLGTLLLLLELAAAALVLYRRQVQPPPPVPDLAALEPLTRTELEAQIARCRFGTRWWNLLSWRDAAAWQQLGEQYLALGYFPEAEACLRQALTWDRHQADAAFRHAFALERLGRIDEAIAGYEEALRRGHKRRADIHYSIGKNHLRAERREAAQAAFQAAGDLAAARYELALLAAEAGQGEQARTLAEQLAQEHPQAYHPAALLHRLAVWQNDRAAAGRWADAFEARPHPLPSPFDTEFDWVVRTANSLGRDRRFRDAGRLYHAGQLAEAERLLRQTLEAAWSPEAADRLADTLALQRRLAEAREVLQDMLARDGPTWELLWRLGQAEADLGRRAEAEAYWQRAVTLATGPAAAELYRDLSQWYQASQPQRARHYQARAALAEGIGQLDQGQAAAALRFLEDAVKADPELAPAWFFLGQARRRLGQTAAARQAYEQCLRLQPHHGRAAAALALLPPP
ncbi:MAG: tetratricopeptide repeat protein [Gemmataceae bacterium]|nr:tetratricopeptide repeat protein [Gemmataceae bacterium]